MALECPGRRQIWHLYQSVGGEIGRLSTLENGGCDVRRQESKLEIASNIALIAVLAISDVFDGAGVAAAKLPPPCMRPDERRDESEIGRAFAASLVPNQEAHFPAAPTELARSCQHNRPVDLFGARQNRTAALRELFEKFCPAELNHEPICVHHYPVDQMPQKRALGAVRSSEQIRCKFVHAL